MDRAFYKPTLYCERKSDHANCQEKSTHEFLLFCAQFVHAFGKTLQKEILSHYLDLPSKLEECVDTADDSIGHL